MSKRDTAKVSVRVYMTRPERKALKKAANDRNTSLTKYIYNIIKTSQNGENK